MSFGSKKKENERLAAEAEAKRLHEEMMRELARHPLVKRGCDRNVRDAYLHGIVCAALADGDVAEIDADERKVIESIASSLGYGSDELASVASYVTSQCVDESRSVRVEAMEALLKECMRQLPDAEAVNVFACDFARVWLARGYENADVGDLEDTFFKESFLEWTGVGLPKVPQKALTRVLGYPVTALDCDLQELAKWLGDDVLKYLVLDTMGDVGPRLDDARAKQAKRETEEKARIEAANARRVETDRFKTELVKVGAEFGETVRMSSDSVVSLTKRVRDSDAAKIDLIEILAARAAALECDGKVT